MRDRSQEDELTEDQVMAGQWGGAETWVTWFQEQHR